MQIESLVQMHSLEYQGWHSTREGRQEVQLVPKKKKMILSIHKMTAADIAGFHSSPAYAAPLRI